MRSIGPWRAPAATLALAGLLPTAALAAPTAGDRAVAAAERRIERAPDSADALVELAAAFMQKARETGEPSYYDRAAAAVERGRGRAPGHYGALRAEAWVLLGRHDFVRAARSAKRTRALAPDDWWNHANLADACLELGAYAQAARAIDTLAALRPGVAAYTRVAAFRALTGDRRGAILALELALAAVDPADAEGRAWVLTYLGHEHWALGDLPRARARYEQALAAFAEYHLALPALARVRAAEGRTGEAIALYARALALAPSPAVAGALGDLYAAGGHPEQARATYDFAVYMGRVATARGQTLGRELALFLADHDRDLPEALRLARGDATARRDVYTHDVLAWALYKSGRPAEAKRAIARALRLHTEDALFEYHAGMIAAALDRPRPTARHLRRALTLNPAFDLRQAALARATLAVEDGPDRLARRDREAP